MCKKGKNSVSQIVENSKNVIQVAGNYVVKNIYIEQVFQLKSNVPFKPGFLLVWLILSFVYSAILLNYGMEYDPTFTDDTGGPFPTFMLYGGGFFVMHITYGVMGYIFDSFRDNTDHSVIHWYFYPVWFIIRFSWWMTMWIFKFMFFFVLIGK